MYKGAHFQRPASAVESMTEPLSKREIDVLRLLAAGWSNQEIAQSLMIAESTVKMHIKNLYSKLAVHNRVQAVTQAQALSLI